MKLFLFLIPVIYAGAPGEWGCKSLDQQGSYDEDCIASKSYSNGVHSISTNKGNDQSRICVATLEAADLLESKNFYLKATFNQPPGSKLFYGGVSYNMEDPKHGNYILLRIGVPVSGNVEIGYLEDGKKESQGIYTMEQPKTFPLTVEVLVKDGEETIWLNGQLDTKGSAIEPHFSVNGKVGIGIQYIPMAQTATVSNAQICTPVKCEKDDGTIIEGGDTFMDSDGLKECTCTSQGIVCECPAPTISCPGGTSLWTDPEICESKCIRPPSYCSSTGDPHYHSFDNKYFDFHGVCSYQAATCGDFTVYFKNVDLHNRPPRYTKRIELEFKGDRFMIGAGNLVAVNPDENNIVTNVAIPYTKTYTDGSRVEIINNGQLEIRLYSKGRDPAVRLRSTNYGTWINAEMWLHGSCADITEGLCGTVNGNPNDDLWGGTPNSAGQHYQEYDENCPEPPKPFNPCTDLIPGMDMTDDAYEKCKILEQNPFSPCHAAVPTGGKDGPGILKNCISDVCNCMVDEDCACSQFDTYATSCGNHGVDISNWAADVPFCPMKCPDGMTYKPDGASPPATCGKAAGTDKVRGCFCPDDKVFQDGKCISSSECKCLHEGVIYNNGDEIKKEAECKVCTCQDGGSMTCGDMECPTLDCKDNEIESKLDDKCCLVCDDSWVKALNPDNKAEQGQKVVLTCQVNAEGVKKKDITWYKDGKKVTDGVSKNKLLLTLDDVNGDDSGTYTCEAKKDGKTGSDDFNVEVEVKEQCEHEDGHKWDVGTKYSPTATTECLCEAGGEFECGCKDDGEECPAATPVAWFDDDCVKTCVPEPGLCQASTDPHYTSFDGKRFDFKGDCIYHIFQCDNVAITADHEKDRASTHTRALEFSYKGDTYRLEKDTVKLNGAEVTVPLHKEFKDGAALYIENVGDYKLRLVKNGMDPFVAVTWDKQSTYSIEAHGTCKGKTKGMCGNWNDDEADDFEGKDGKVKETAEEFGQSWGLDDEVDCKVEPPPPSVCEEMGLKDKEEGLKKYIESVFSVGVMEECFKKIGDETIVQNAVDDICFCFDDKQCGCPRLRNFATECKDKEGIDTDGWELNNQKSECAPECPEGSTYIKKGPKPAPTCANPEGGKKKQPGCFCPEGQVLEENKCIDVGECKCEYAGKLYNKDEKYDKEETCETCTCKGGGAEDTCTEIKCDTKCKKGEIEVEVEGQCCPECQGDWLTAVNPDAEGKLGEALELTCEVADGVDVKDVKWIKFNPGEKDVTNIKKKYSVSADGLTLTIKKMAEDMTGNYKCVAETNDGTKAEAEFEVSSPIEHEELIDPEKEDVDIVPGEDVVLKVDKLGGVITAIYWECNGERITSKTPGYKIVNKNKYNTLTILDAEKADAGNCVCVAEGVGTEDKAVFNLKAEELEELNLIDPAQTDVTYTPGDALTITVNKDKANGKKIEDISLECNGKKVEGKNVKVNDGKKFVSFTIDPADESYEGKCVVTAGGAGLKDDTVDINVTAEEAAELVLTAKPRKTDVECKAKKKGCNLQFTVGAKRGDKTIKVPAKFVKVCKLVNGKPAACKKAACKYPNFCRKLKPAAGDAGEYVAVVELEGQKVVSDPVTLTVV